jgi:hemolysin activation/secretion protein
VSGLQRFKRATAWWSAAFFILMVHTAVAWAGDEPIVSAPEAPVVAAPTMEVPEATGPTEEPAAAEPQRTEPPAELTFAVASYHVDGNTLLASEQVETALAPFTGPQMRVADVDRARVVLETLYHDVGYPAVLVALPEQTLENGVVRLQVMESKLAEVTVSGNRYISTQRLRDKLPSISPGAILHEPTVLAELDAVNATPDRQVAPVLTVGGEPGTVNMELKVKDRLPLHGNVEWNNRGTPSTPDQRLSASVRYSDMFAREHTLALQTTQTPQNLGAVAIYSASYVAPLGDGRSVSGYVATSNSGSVLDASSINEGEVGISGNATLVGIRYAFEPRTSQQLSIGLDYKHLGKSEAQFPDGKTLVSTNPIVYAPVSLAYSGSERDAEGATRWSLSIKEHITDIVPGGGRKEFGGDPENMETMPGNRDGATGTFFVLQAGAGRVQQLDDNFSLAASVTGQLASEPLIPAEQLFAGGVESVRGYLENEAQGDHGVRGSVELTSPRLAFARQTRWLRGALQGALFIDGAGLWRKDPRPGEIDGYTLVGAGVGLRVSLGNGLTAKLDQGWALADGAITRRGDTRGHVSVTLEF